MRLVTSLSKPLRHDFRSRPTLRLSRGKNGKIVPVGGVVDLNVGVAGQAMEGGGR